MNKLLICALLASVLLFSVIAEPLVQDGVAHESIVEDGVAHESINIRERRATSCRSVSSQPNNPQSYNEACRAHCILNGKKGGSCVGGSCSCR
ncbi:hypothetical protein FQA39_LY01567 [Lamprigera yunnana]|nr:hypothetical protein FQA39_LY01567 [Lamprigera yunnana]